MLKTIKFRSLFALGLLMWFCISAITLFTAPVDSKNINIVSLHLKSVSGNRPSRGSLNYDLYVAENNGHYKVGADCADCFYYNDFIDNVKPGELIKVGVRKNNGFYLDGLKLVVSIDADNRNFLDSSCVNRSLADSKINLPIFSAIGLIVIYILFYFQEIKDLKKRPKIN